MDPHSLTVAVIAVTLVMGTAVAWSMLAGVLVAYVVGRRPPRD